jgi:TonB family protein
MPDALVRFAELFWTAMLVHLWQTTLVLALLWVLSRALKDAPARLQATLWWIGVLKLFLPLSLLAPVASRLVDSLVGWFGGGSVSSQVEWISAPIWLYPVTLPESADRTAPLAGWLYAALLLAWFAGLGWILVCRLRRSRRETARTWNALGNRRGRLEAKLGDALAPTKIPQGTVCLVRGSGMPAVRGLLQPRIEIPAQVVEELAVPDLTAVLLHEAEHCRRKDPLRQVLAVLASWLFFFYPPVRWLLRRVYETTEMACDEAVLRDGVAPRDYARSIARTLELGLGPADTRFAFIGPGRSSLRRRLARLNTERRYRTMLTHRIVLAVAALVALLGSVVPLTPGAQAADEKAVDASSSVRFGALDRLAGAGTEVTLEFNKAAADDVLDVVSGIAGFKLILDPTVSDKEVSLSTKNSTVREALIKIGINAGLLYEVPNPTTLRVRGILIPGEDGVSPPVRIEDSAVRPVYPEAMRQAKIQGRVVIQATIDSNGEVAEIEVLTADHPAFGEAAIEAIEQWRYKPATLDGNAVGVYFTIVVAFNLDGDKSEPKEGSESL